jgi:hypothetical protein
MLHKRSQLRERLIGRQEGVDLRLLRPRLRLRGPHIRDEAGHDHHCIGIAFGYGNTPLHILVVLLPAGEVICHRIDTFGITGGQLPARAGGAGLEQYRSTLRRARHRQRAVYPKVFAGVADRSHPGLVSIETSTVQDQSIVLP